MIGIISFRTQLLKMPPKKSNVYNKLCQLWRALHPEDSGNKTDSKVKELYYDPWKQGKIEDIDTVILDLESQVEKKKLKIAKSKITYFGFKKVTPSSISPSSSSDMSSLSSAGTSAIPSGSLDTKSQTSSSSAEIIEPSESLELTETPDNLPKKTYKTPAQDKLKSEIQDHRQIIQNYLIIPNMNLTVKQQLKKEPKGLEEKERKLKKMQQSALRSQKHYDKKSACLKRAASLVPDDEE